jgi:hypothetical protein
MEIWKARFSIMCYVINIQGGTKNPIKINGWNHHMKDKREGQRKANKHTTHINQKRERASPSRGRKLSHP